MKADSRIFGKIEIEDDKIITLEKGMIGFPDLNHFALIYDEEKEKKYNSIMWLQSMDDPDIAFPVMMPHIVKEDYNPNVSEEMIAPLGKLTPENTYILVTVTVPKNIEDFSVNLKAPVVINMDNRKGVQKSGETRSNLELRHRKMFRYTVRKCIFRFRKKTRRQSALMASKH